MRRPKSKKSEGATFDGTFLPSIPDSDWSEEDGSVGIELWMSCSIEPQSRGSTVYQAKLAVNWMENSPDLLVSISVRDRILADPVLLQATQLRCIAHVATLYPGFGISFWLPNEAVGFLEEHLAPVDLRVAWMLQGRHRYSRVEIPPEKIEHFSRVYHSIMVTGLVRTRSGWKVRLKSRLFSDLLNTSEAEFAA